VQLAESQQHERAIRATHTPRAIRCFATRYAITPNPVSLPDADRFLLIYFPLSA